MDGQHQSSEQPQSSSSTMDELPDIRLSSSDFLVLEEALNSGPFAEFAGLFEFAFL
jgi:hypothetical protein